MNTRKLTRVTLALALILTGYIVGSTAISSFEGMMETRTAHAIRMMGE